MRPEPTCLPMMASVPVPPLPRPVQPSNTKRSTEVNAEVALGSHDLVADDTNDATIS